MRDVESSNGTLTTMSEIGTTIANNISMATTVVSTVTNATTNGSHQPPIFLQTRAAQGIGGTCAILALIVTVHQVCVHMYSQTCL